jgi:hypothetical protein
MTTTRTDIHRPSEIKPSDYDFIALHYIGPDVDEIGFTASMIVQRDIVDAHQKLTNATWSNHAHGGTCHCCGATALHLCVFYHRDTNQYIVTGIDCADQIADGLAPKMRKFREGVKQEREYAAGKTRRALELEKRGLSHALDSKNGIVYDILEKLRRYGSLSEAQWRFVQNLLVQDVEAAARQKQQDEERAAAKDIPDTLFKDRQTVRMTVVGMKKPDLDAMYPSWKLILKHDDGWLLMGSRPATLDDVERGDVVEFAARFNRGKDSKFGFYSRPTKASVVTAGE